MRLNVNLDIQKIVSKGGTNLPVSSLTFVRGDQLQLDVYFYEQGSAVSTDIGNVPIIFGGKESEKFDEDYLFHADTYTKLTIGGDTVYRFELGLNTQQLNDALEVDAITTNDKSQITVNVELQWTIGTLTTSTVRQLAAVLNDINKGGEGIPDPANPSYATLGALGAVQVEVAQVDAQLIDAVSISGANLVFSRKGQPDLVLDATAFLADVKASGASYNSATQNIDFTMSDGSSFSVPVGDLLPVTTDATLNGNGSTVPLSVAPHSHTKAEVGLSEVDNTKDIDKIVSNPQQAAINAIGGSAFARVVYEGDSITGGTPQPAGQTTHGQYAPTWATQIQPLSAFDSTTSHHITAVSGSQQADVQARYASQVAIHKPAQNETRRVVLACMIGINDIASGALTEATLDTWFTSLEAYYTQAKADGFFVLAIAPLIGASNSQVHRKLRQKLLSSGVPDQVVDASTFVEHTNSTGMYEDDNLHLTAKGGKRMAEFVNAYLITGQSSRISPIYDKGGILYFQNNANNAILPNGEYRFSYLLRMSNGDFSQKNSSIMGVAPSSNSIALAGSHNSTVLVARSGYNIEFGVADTSSDIQTVRWRIENNGLWRASQHSSKTDFSQNNCLHQGFVPASGQVFSGSSSGQYGLVLPAGVDYVIAGSSSGVQSESFKVRSNGDIVAKKLRIFVDHAAADADDSLKSKSFYSLDGGRAIYQKP